MRGVGAVRGMAIGPAPATVEQHPSPLRQPYQVSVTSFKQKRFRPLKAGSARAPVEIVACPESRSGACHIEMANVRRSSEAFLEPVAVALPRRQARYFSYCSRISHVSTSTRCETDSMD